MAKKARARLRRWRASSVHKAPHGPWRGNSVWRVSGGPYAREDMPSFACFREVQNSRGGMAPLSRGRGAELLTGGRASDTPEGFTHDRGEHEPASACDPWNKAQLA